jgi:hypothetical protein
MRAARDRHPAPESSGYRPIRGEADGEALAPRVRHVPHPSAGRPALALSCHEADNLSEADRHLPTKSGRFQRAEYGTRTCLGLPYDRYRPLSLVRLTTSRT